MRIFCIAKTWKSEICLAGMSYLADCACVVVTATQPEDIDKGRFNSNMTKAHLQLLVGALGLNPSASVE